MVDFKDTDPNLDSESDPKNIENRQIIDVEPTSIVVTITIQPEELEDHEEGEHLFHSQMWVKETPMHFIVDSESQKSLISKEVLKKLFLSITPHPHLYNIGWLFQG